MTEAYSFGRITIDWKGYTKDVIVFPGRLKGGWWLKEGHRLQLADLGEVFAENPGSWHRP
ncbi:MAG: hypothetical protein ABII71_00095 [Candidatus Micrarchaeota archaeon]